MRHECPPGATQRRSPGCRFETTEEQAVERCGLDSGAVTHTLRPVDEDNMHVSGAYYILLTAEAVSLLAVMGSV
jgi:hypothetical protein